MPTPFIPLTLSGSTTASGSPGSPFQRLHALNPVPGSAPGAVAVSPAAACGKPGSSPPVVTLRRNGEQVTHIRIQCACGELIELECSF